MWIPVTGVIWYARSACKAKRDEMLRDWIPGRLAYTTEVRSAMPGNPTAATERAVTVQFVGRTDPIAPAELYMAVRAPGATRTAIDSAVEALLDAGVLLRAPHGRLRASKTLAKLDALKLVDV
jgi:hypothetical protein